VCGLQRRITQTTNSLAERVEALEKALTKGGHDTVNKLARECHNDRRIEHSYALAASIADLETRFQLFSSETAAQMATCTTALAELREQTHDGPSFLTENVLQACIQNASCHVIRLEKLSKKWTELQKVQCRSGSVDAASSDMPTSQINLASDIPQRVPLETCSHGVDQLRLKEQVWRYPQVHALVRPVAHTFCCCPTLQLVQCHEPRGTCHKSHEHGASSSTDDNNNNNNNNSSGPSISCSLTNAMSSERSLATSNSSIGSDSQLMQERASWVAQQKANGGHRLLSPRSGPESRPCFVLPQPISSPPAVLAPHSAPVRLCSPLLIGSLSPPQLNF